MSSQSPLGDEWMKHYSFNPDAKVTMPICKDHCPSVSPFEKKPEEPKPFLPNSPQSTSSSSSSSSSIFKSPFRNKNKASANSTMTSSSSGSNKSIFDSKYESGEGSKKEKQNGCKQS